MNRRGLYLLIGLLAGVIVILGYNYYQDQQQSGIEININKDGISVEEK